MPLDKERIRELTRYPDEYFSGSHIFGTLGRFFAIILLRTPITPNQITWFWGGLMVVSALLYSTGDYICCIVGGALWIVAYALDYTDGVVAKYKKQFSARGGYLDMVIHYTTYPLLMFCIGYGVYVSGGVSWITFDWFQDIWYIFFGLAAGVGIDIFMVSTLLYEKFREGDGKFQDRRGSMGVEGNMFKNKGMFKLLMNFNPLVFTNMKIMLLVFAVINQMGLFIIVYGLGYAAAACARVLLLYKDL